MKSFNTKLALTFKCFLLVILIGCASTGSRENIIYSGHDVNNSITIIKPSLTIEVSKDRILNYAGKKQWDVKSATETRHFFNIGPSEGINVSIITYTGRQKSLDYFYSTPHYLRNMKKAVMGEVVFNGRKWTKYVDSYQHRGIDFLKVGYARRFGNDFVMIYRWQGAGECSKAIERFKKTGDVSLLKQMTEEHFALNERLFKIL